MKKRLFALLTVLAMLTVTVLTACGGGDDAGTAENTDTDAPAQEEPADDGDAEPAADGGAVTLTMGSWRTDDVEQMNNLLAAYKEVAPDVTIEFQPTNPADYNATLRTQLEGGTGPDLMYARSYETGRELFSSGFFADLSDLPGLMENFSDDARDPWSAEDGSMFAVPFAAVSHGVYYNKTLFAENDIEIPETFDDFLAACATLQNAGVTPLANGVADEWDVLECLFLGMVPNYIGGMSAREGYESGATPMNDDNWVNAWSDLAELGQYLPTGFEAITYNDSQVMFETQQAAMFMDGSWTAGVYEDPDLDWGVFAMPARSAADTAITFHMDMAIGMNAATENPEACRDFLAWLCTEEGAKIASENLPVGYFPVISFDIPLADAHANEFLQLNEGRTTDVRFVWPVLMDLYAPMNQEVISVLKGATTPQEAADAMEAAMP